MKKAGFGLIGTGLWGEMHARTYTSSPEVELKAICDLREDRAKEVADKYGVKDWYSDYKELLERDDISAVSIATPDFAHTDIAVAAAKTISPGVPIRINAGFSTMTKGTRKQTIPNRIAWKPIRKG